MTTDASTARIPYALYLEMDVLLTVGRRLAPRYRVFLNGQERGRIIMMPLASAFQSTRTFTVRRGDGMPAAGHA